MTRLMTGHRRAFQFRAPIESHSVYWFSDENHGQAGIGDHRDRCKGAEMNHQLVVSEKVSDVRCQVELVLVCLMACPCLADLRESIKLSTALHSQSSDTHFEQAVFEHMSQSRLRFVPATSFDDYSDRTRRRRRLNRTRYFNSTGISHGGISATL